MAAAPPAVLLGLRDAAVPPGNGLRSRGAASKLGGSPDWRPSLRAVHPPCGICEAGMLHVVQIYCPLDGSLYHRVINVFACTTESCWGNSKSWKVLRSQYLQVPRKEIQDCTWKQMFHCPTRQHLQCEKGVGLVLYLYTLACPACVGGGGDHGPDLTIGAGFSSPDAPTPDPPTPPSRVQEMLQWFPASLLLLP